MHNFFIPISGNVFIARKIAYALACVIVCGPLTGPLMLLKKKKKKRNGKAKGLNVK